jgi:hypothetical protein
MPRPTSELEPSKIAKLRADSRPPPEEEEEVSFADLEVDEPGPPVAVLARSETLHDPLTTSLLAEVARRSQTMELDTDPADDVHAAIRSVVIDDRELQFERRPITRRR